MEDDYKKAIAIIQGKGEGIKETLQEILLKIKPEINTLKLFKDSRVSLLYHAAVHENEKAFDILLANGADPALKSDQGTVLHSILKRGNVSWADKCIMNMDEQSRIKFINQGSKTGWTALMSAAENNQVESVDWLICNGADVNIKMEKTGWNALHAAAKMSHYDILNSLLKAGGDVTAKGFHKVYGQNLTLKDLTTEKKLLDLISEYENKQEK